MKKILLLIIPIFLLTGCTSYTELNDLSIVNTVGIDYKDDKFILTMNVIDGKLDDSMIEKTLTTYYSEEATLEEAFHTIYLNSNKRLYLSHIDVLILTKDAINEEFQSIIKNFLENNEYRNNFNVVLLKDTELTDFMNEQILAEDIINLLKTNMQETSITILKDFEILMKELLIDGNTYLPSIDYNDSDTKLVLNGYTLIKDYKVYEDLSIEESIILNFLNNNIHKTYINDTNVFENQTIVTTNKNKISFKFLTTVNKDNNFKEKMISDMNNFLKKYQEKDYDVLKLLDKVRKNDYSYYKDTKDLLSKLKFNISVDITEKNEFLQGDLLYEKR